MCPGLIFWMGFFNISINKHKLLSRKVTLNIIFVKTPKSFARHNT